MDGPKAQSSGMPPGPSPCAQTDLMPMAEGRLQAPLLTPTDPLLTMCS